MFLRPGTITSSLGELTTGVTLSHRFRSLNETRDKFGTLNDFSHEAWGAEKIRDRMEQERPFANDYYHYHDQEVTAASDSMYLKPRRRDAHSQVENKFRFTPRNARQREENHSDQSFRQPSFRPRRPETINYQRFDARDGRGGNRRGQNGSHRQHSDKPVCLSIPRERPANEVAKMLREGRFGTGDSLGISQVVTGKGRSQEYSHGSGKQRIQRSSWDSKHRPSLYAGSYGKSSEWPWATSDSDRFDYTFGSSHGSRETRGPQGNRRGNGRGKRNKGNPGYPGYPKVRVSRLDLDTELDMFCSKRTLNSPLKETMSSFEATDRAEVEPLEVEEEIPTLEDIRDCLRLYS